LSKAEQFQNRHQKMMNCITTYITRLKINQSKTTKIPKFKNIISMELENSPSAGPGFMRAAPFVAITFSIFQMAKSRGRLRRLLNACETF
jgi:hypothetical protein